MEIKHKLEALLEKDAVEIIKSAVSRAKSGDGAALRMCLERLLPTRERMISLVGLPTIASASDIPTALGFIVGAVTKGEITPSEGSTLCGMLTSMRSAFELVDLAARLEAIERALPGPQGGSGTASGSGGEQ
jgi:hypothetical protein